MKRSKAADEHTTREGAQRLLEFWLYGILKASQELGTSELFVRKIEEAAVDKFVEEEHAGSRHFTDPAHAIRAYVQLLDDRGMMEASAATVRGDGERAKVEIGAACPYRAVCNWVHSEGHLSRCFRATAFVEYLERSMGRRYDPTLDEFGVPCKITLSPSKFTR